MCIYTILRHCYNYRKQKIRKHVLFFSDVISAYKGVVKEKEALESSVKVLSQSKSKAHLEIPHSKGPASDSASDRGQESDRESEDGSRTGKDHFNVSTISKVSQHVNCSTRFDFFTV